MTAWSWIKHIFTKNEDQGDPGQIPLFTDSEMEWYLLQVYSGMITDHNLSIEYHYKVAAYLQQALAEGFGPPITTEAYEAYIGLRKHIYIFSAAKQYSQVREMSALINLKGNTGDFKSFRETADKIFGTYNKTYLKTEYTTAVGQSEMAKQWVEFQATKATMPKLRYHTQLDARVRDEHAALEGITLPVDDKFWNTYMPKNGWRCRCFVTQETDEEPETDMSQKTIPEWGDKAFPKVFRMNPGKDQLIFNPRFHPYFRVAPGDSDFKAENFGLPTS